MNMEYSVSHINVISLEKPSCSVDAKKGVSHSCQALGRGMTHLLGPGQPWSSLIFLTVNDVYDSSWRWATRSQENTVEKGRALNQQPKLESQLNYLWAVWSWKIYLIQQSLGSPRAKWCWWYLTSRMSWGINEIIWWGGHTHRCTGFRQLGFEAWVFPSTEYVNEVRMHLPFMSPLPSYMMEKCHLKMKC